MPVCTQAGLGSMTERSSHERGLDARPGRMGRDTALRAGRRMVL